MFNQDFYSNFLSNLLATVIGIGFGLPIALWLDRIFRSRNEKEKARESFERVKKILILLQSELKENQDSIDKFHEDVSNYYHPVRVESWNAFSDGGELQWLNDPELLAVLSSTYATINHYHSIYDKYVQASLFPISIGSPELKKRIFNIVVKQQDVAKKQITLCLELISIKIIKLTCSVISNGAG